MALLSITDFRIEVCNRIIKGFVADLNLIEKSAQYTHKYIRKIETKTGKIRYIYNQPSNVKRIKGKRKDLDNGTKEITVNSKSMINYDDKQRNELYNLLSKTEGVTNLHWSDARSTESRYLKFRKDNIRFKVRLSKHTVKTDHNEVIFPVTIKTRLDCVIDASLGNYKPTDVTTIVDHVVSNFAKYDNDRTKAKLKAVAGKHKLYPLGDDDSLNMSLTVADAYINDHNQKDDKYGTLNQVIRNLAVDVLNDMADDNLDHEAVKQKRPNKKLSK